MREIVIRIQVPEGVAVSVNGEARPTRQSDDRPFVARPDPPFPGGYCPVHEVEWKLVPAGTSQKTGKQYNAFWACPEYLCDQKPPRNATPAMEIVGSDDLPF